MWDTIETVITTARAMQLSRRAAESVGGAFEADLLLFSAQSRAKYQRSLLTLTCLVV